MMQDNVEKIESIDTLNEEDKDMFKNAWDIVVDKSCEDMTPEDKELFVINAMNLVMNVLDVRITESNKGTPRRVARMWLNEVFRTYGDRGIEDLKEKCRVFPNELGDQSTPIIIGDIPFSSFCEHHLLPFFGKATISYVPRKEGVIIGLSKVPRVVEYFCDRPQLQERLTQDIGNFLVDILDPISLTVELKAEHTCVSCRGIKSNVLTTTNFDYSRTQELLSKMCNCGH